MRYPASIVWKDGSNDEAHYHASLVLDDVLGWFVDDGYSGADLEELALEHVERVLEDS